MPYNKVRQKVHLFKGGMNAVDKLMSIIEEQPRI